MLPTCALVMASRGRRRLSGAMRGGWEPRLNAATTARGEVRARAARVGPAPSPPGVTVRHGADRGRAGLALQRGRLRPRWRAASLRDAASGDRLPRRSRLRFLTAWRLSRPPRLSRCAEVAPCRLPIGEVLVAMETGPATAGWPHRGITGSATMVEPRNAADGERRGSAPAHATRLAVAALAISFARQTRS